MFPLLVAQKRIIPFDNAATTHWPCAATTQEIADSGPVALQTDDSVCSAQGAQSAPGTVRAEEICAETGAQPDGDQLSVPWWRDHLPCDVVATLCIPAVSLRPYPRVRLAEGSGYYVEFHS